VAGRPGAVEAVPSPQVFVAPVPQPVVPETAPPAGALELVPPGVVPANVLPVETGEPQEAQQGCAGLGSLLGLLGLGGLLGLC